MYEDTDTIIISKEIMETSDCCKGIKDNVKKLCHIKSWRKTKVQSLRAGKNIKAIGLEFGKKYLEVIPIVTDTLKETPKEFNE